MRIKPLLIARRRAGARASGAGAAGARRSRRRPQPSAGDRIAPTPRRHAPADSASPSAARDESARRGSDAASSSRRRRRRSNIPAGRGATRGPSAALDPADVGLGDEPVGRRERRLPVDPDAADGHADRLALGAYRAARCAARQGAGRRATSIRSTGSPSAPGCCCGWARPTPRGCSSPASTPTASRRRWSRSAVQSALANADPPALCPLEDGIRKYEPRHPRAGQAMCASLAGRAGKRRRADRRRPPPRPHRRDRPGAGREGRRRRRRYRPRGDDRMGPGRSPDRVALRPRDRDRHDRRPTGCSTPPRRSFARSRRGRRC